ncbi:MAG: glycosyltransferase family 1 protein [Bacteroidales bacterium]|nr:glycosyltransferase family 1 protein [Bacteroidales bacterium]MCK4638145.1 glycosyltransferase family 1 protein [Bacteroidales bacterium]
MSEKHIHIVSFDIPYPPNYGGVIDVFYKIKALHQNGIKIHLHCIEYPGRDRTKELNKYCESVNYYRRKTGLSSAFSLKPYIVSSRKSEELITNLLKDDYPIIFEGLHSCFYIDDARLKNRIKIYRESNIEHRYYYNLFKVVKNLYNKFYFIIETIKLRLYQNVLKHADLMLVVSQKDTEYLQHHFKNKKVVYLPSFHRNENPDIKPGTGKYALYHGNIEVPENAHAASFLINEVFNDLDFPLVVAGMNPPEQIKKLIDSKPNVKLISNPDDEKMFELIRNAHVNVLVTFQATGLKLKLLNTLYNGRFCLVNEKMLNGTLLNDLCVIANNSFQLKNKLKTIFKDDFDEDQIELRKQKLNGLYSNKINAERLISYIS